MSPWSRASGKTSRHPSAAAGVAGAAAWLAWAAGAAPPRARKPPVAGEAGRW